MPGNPVRVPDASLRDIALFAQDEWRLRPNLSLIAGLRGDFYNVTTEATPGYDVSSVVAGATPADRSRRRCPIRTAPPTRAQSLTGDIGLVANQAGRVSPFIRFGRSYRHPNLEEMFFAGPATVGSIVPNVKVEARDRQQLRRRREVRASAASRAAPTSSSTSTRTSSRRTWWWRPTPSGPLAQATNYADVRITGVEFSADAPIVLRQGVLTLIDVGRLHARHDHRRREPAGRQRRWTTRRPTTSRRRR